MEILRRRDFSFDPVDAPGDSLGSGDGAESEWAIVPA